MEIGQAIYTIRKQRGLKLDAVATVVETDTGYLSRIEKGTRQPSIDMLGRIATALGCRISEMFALAENSVSLPSSIDFPNAGQITELGTDANELRKALRDLSHEDRMLVADFAKMLSRRQKTAR